MIEDNFPLEGLAELASVESRSREFTRPIYSLHKWWAKRFGCIFRTIGICALTDIKDPQQIINFTNKVNPSYSNYYRLHNYEHKTVVDPFMGGGTTIVELNRMNVKLVGCDINPVSWWTVKKEVEDLDISKFKKEFRNLSDTVGVKIASCFKTECECGNKNADVIYYLWVKHLNCIKCNQKVHLFKNYIVADGRIDIPRVICPECWNIFPTQDVKTDVKCDECNNTFNPSNGNTSGGNYICSCGQKYSISKQTQKQKKLLESELFAIDYYCQICKGSKKIKAPQNSDYQLIQEISKTLSKNNELLNLIPKQKLLDDGFCYRHTNYYYRSFSEIFTDRQLYGLTLLLSQILKIKDQNIREFFITAFSYSIEYNNSFTIYAHSVRKSAHIFTRHAYNPPTTFTEVNLWGVKDKNKLIGNGSFTSFVDKVIRAKEYCKKPFEKIPVEDKKTKKVNIQNEKIKGQIVDDFSDISSNHLQLLCQTSESLPIPDKSVDAIITDPPYFDNVMYSELADFFYIWLKKALEDDYPDIFKSELSPTLNEIVVNPTQKKDEGMFINGLTNVFKECNRILKDEGVMVFTYHHKQSKAWTGVLKAVLNSKFIITSIYPVHSEPITSIHIKNKDSIEYDTIIVCRKKKAQESITFKKFEQELYTKAQIILDEEISKHKKISKGDISVIVFGKCLQIVSNYYPNITADGNSVGIEEAVEKVWEIIDLLSMDDSYIPQEIDSLSRFFTANLADGKSMTYDELNKILVRKGIDVSELEAEKLIRGPKKEKVTTDADERKSLIDTKIKKGDDLLDIDKAQYLYLLYITDKNVSQWLRKWRTPELEQLCKILADKTGDDRYNDVMKVTLDMF